jgi:hypothetical protein
MTYWKLFVVEFPGGEEREYDYVTVVECAKFSDLEASITDLESEEALGDSKRAESVNVGRPAKMVHQNVAAIVESTENWPSAKTGYLRVRLMKPREGQERGVDKPRT